MQAQGSVAFTSEVGALFRLNENIGFRASYRFAPHEALYSSFQHEMRLGAHYNNIMGSVWLKNIGVEAGYTIKILQLRDAPSINNPVLHGINVGLMMQV